MKERRFVLLATNNYIRRKILRTEVHYSYYDRDTEKAGTDKLIIFGRLMYSEEKLVRYISGHTNRIVLKIIGIETKTEVYRMSVNEFIKHAERV